MSAKVNCLVSIRMKSSEHTSFHGVNKTLRLCTELAARSEESVNDCPDSSEETVVP